MPEELFIPISQLPSNPFTITSSSTLTVTFTTAAAAATAAATRLNQFYTLTSVPKEREKPVPRNVPGLIGFVADHRPMLAYAARANPETTGLTVLEFVRKQAKNLTQFRGRVWSMRCVNPYATPTEEELDRYPDWAQKGVTWAASLSPLNSNLEGYYDAGLILDQAALAMDSSEVNWAYVVDMDASALEVYRAADAPHSLGRFARSPEAQAYMPLGRIPLYEHAKWGFNALPPQDEYYQRLINRSKAEPAEEPPPEMTAEELKEFALAELKGLLGIEE